MSRESRQIKNHFVVHDQSYQGLKEKPNHLSFEVIDLPKIKDIIDLYSMCLVCVQWQNKSCTYILTPGTRIPFRSRNSNRCCVFFALGLTNWTPPGARFSKRAWIIPGGGGSAAKSRNTKFAIFSPHENLRFWRSWGQGPVWHDTSELGKLFSSFFTSKGHSSPLQNGQTIEELASFHISIHSVSPPVSMLLWYFPEPENIWTQALLASYTNRFPLPSADKLWASMFADSSPGFPLNFHTNFLVFML